MDQAETLKIWDQYTQNTHPRGIPRECCSNTPFLPLEELIMLRTLGKPPKK